MSYSTKCKYLVTIGSLNQAHAFYRVKQSAFISCVCVCVCALFNQRRMVMCNCHTKLYQVHKYLKCVVCMWLL